MAAKAKASPEAVEPEAVEAAPEVVEEAPEAVEPRSGVVTVTWGNGSREYSKEIHGAEYRKLAAQFAEKVKGTVA